MKFIKKTDWITLGSGIQKNESQTTYLPRSSIAQVAGQRRTHHVAGDENRLEQTALGVVHVEVALDLQQQSWRSVANRK